MKLLDSIQSKVLQIIGVNDQQAKSDLNIKSRPILLHNLSRNDRGKENIANRKHCENIETSLSHVETSSKNRLRPV